VLHINLLNIAHLLNFL